MDANELKEQRQNIEQLRYEIREQDHVMANLDMQDQFHPERVAENRRVYDRMIEQISQEHLGFLKGKYSSIYRGKSAAVLKDLT